MAPAPQMEHLPGQRHEVTEESHDASQEAKGMVIEATSQAMS